jgi:hypothetical protein
LKAVIADMDAKEAAMAEESGGLRTRVSELEVAVADGVARLEALSEAHRARGEEHEAVVADLTSAHEPA